MPDNELRDAEALAPDYNNQAEGASSPESSGASSAESRDDFPSMESSLKVIQFGIDTINDTIDDIIDRKYP